MGRTGGGYAATDGDELCLTMSCKVELVESSPGRSLSGCSCFVIAKITASLSCPELRPRPHFMLNGYPAPSMRRNKM